jgi:hypothetical protein
VGLLGLDGDVEEEEHGGREEREERGQRERVAQRRERAHGGPEEEERLQREQPEQRGGVRGGREAAPAAAGGLGRGREGRGRESEGRVRGQPRRRGRPSEAAAPDPRWWWGTAVDSGLRGVDCGRGLVGGSFGCNGPGFREHMGQPEINSAL